ncbi:right-handed parallel beta-helix repeat-containing protein [Spirosoma sp. BT702]|uniref:Right-handed parallel beta-helix repeat-containing protein n=1 Tax=Spirosoma profusum TaxID=2771354 RepID=A0A927ARS1_9BACT|nr:right-handed parallel beta-helix repeat-containing protein [Spirosoma profusum]MBD2700155.1 right-handed parallel beta-helix repeat-containing protein [Spirosoma profusum]
MRFILILLFFLSSLVGLAQTNRLGSLPNPPPGQFTIGMGTDGILKYKLNNQTDLPFKIDPRYNNLPIAQTVSGVRSLSLTKANSPAVINTFEGRKSGTWVLQADDDSTSDNGFTFLRTANGVGYLKLLGPYVTPYDFGAKGGNNDDTTPMALVLDHCKKTGVTLLLTTVFKTTSPISVSLANTTGVLALGGNRLSIIGTGQSSSGIRYGGPPNTTCLSLLGTADDMLNLEGFRIFPTDVTAKNTDGLFVQKLANPTISRISVSYMRTGMTLIDVGEGIVEKCLFDWNKQGSYITVGALGVAPNGIKFLSCAWNSNSNYGVFVENGCTNTFDACRFLSNGWDASAPNRNAVLIWFASFNGAVSVILTGCYLENNRGPHTVHIQVAQENALGSQGGSTVLIGNTFNRFGVTGMSDVVNDVYFDPVNLTSSGPVHSVTMLGNTFVGYYSYAADAAKKRVVFAPGGNAYSNYVVADNNYYQYPEEAPTANFTHKWLTTSLFTTFTTAQTAIDVAQNNAIGNNSTAIAANTSSLTTVNAKVTSLSADVATNTSAIAGKLAIATFTSYSALTAALIADRVTASTYTSYTALVASQLAGKLDISTFSTYSAATASLIADKVAISTYSSYTAGVAASLSSKLDISVYNSYTSAMATTISGKLDISVYSSYTAATAITLAGKLTAAGGSGSNNTFATPTSTGTATFTGKILRPYYNPTDNVVKAGQFGVQPHGAGNTTLTWNAHHDGTNWVRDSAGTAGLLQKLDSELGLIQTVAGTAGLASGALNNNRHVKWMLDGSMYLGTISSAPGSTSGYKWGFDNTTGNTTQTGTATAIQYRLSALNTAPASATDTGTVGEIRVTAGFIYVCVAANTWVRSALSTW